MFSVASQLRAASHHAACLSAERALKDEQARASKAKAEATRQKQWATRKANTGLVQELVARLPVGKANAISLAQVEALFADFPHAPTGLSSALSGLCKTGDVLRIGDRRAYRYYVLLPQKGNP